MIDWNNTFTSGNINGGDEVFCLLKTVRSAAGQIEDFVLEDVNGEAEAFFGQERAALIGQSFFALLPPAMEEDSFHRYIQALETGRSYNHEFSVPASFPLPGRYIQHIVPLSDRLAVTLHSRFDGRFGHARRLHSALEQERVDMLRRFVETAVSHDLRTPLSIMKTSLYLLNRVEDPEKRQRYFSNLERQVEQLENLFENLLALFQFNAEVLRLDLKPVDVNRLIREVLMEQQIPASEKDHHVVFQPAVPHLVAELDETMIAQVVMQVVRNAIRYTENGGMITLSSEQQGSYIRIMIKDNGIGIAEADLPFIFDPFFRADKARQTHVGEMGLGLAVVKRLVEAHDGRVEVESTLGEGSVFRIILPVQANPAG